MAICGLGGVGGFTLEALARLGVGNFLVVDNDTFEATNLNRQILSTFDNIGHLKANEAKKRVNLFSRCSVYDVAKRVQDSISEIASFSPDVIIDAVDDIEAKVLLIESFYKKHEVIVSSGAGNRLDPTKVRFSDISKTSNCSLARKLRKKLKDIGINSGFDVVFSVEEPKVSGSTIGSVSFVPMAFASILSYLCYRKICSTLV